MTKTEVERQEEPQRPSKKGVKRQTGVSLYPPNAGIQADVSMLLVRFSDAVLSSRSARESGSMFYEMNRDYEVFKQIFKEMRWSHIWRGRATAAELKTLTDDLLTFTLQLIEFEPEQRIAPQDCGAPVYERDYATIAQPGEALQWPMVTLQQLGAVYLLHSLYYLQPQNEAHMRARVTLNQLLDLYVLFHTCGRRRLFLTQMCITQLLTDRALVPSASQKHYSPATYVEFNYECAMDVEWRKWATRNETEPNIKDVFDFLDEQQSSERPPLITPRAANAYREGAQRKGGKAGTDAKAAGNSQLLHPIYGRGSS